MFNQALSSQQNCASTIPNLTGLWPVLIILCCSSLVFANDPLPLPSGLDLSLPDMEPAVTLEKHHNRTVEEYRVNNNLYMIIVTPNIGPSYFMVDPDGSGEMEMKRGPADVNVPKWTLFSW